MYLDEDKSTISKLITAGLIGCCIVFGLLIEGSYEIAKDKNNEAQIVGYEAYQVISTIKVRNGRGTYPVIVLQDENGNYNNYTVQIPEIAERLSQLQGNQIALEVRQSENETFYTFEGSRVTIKKNK